MAALFLLVAARGCYSSVAPVPRIDPGDTDTGLPIEEPPPDAGECVPRRPWEGPGVTGVLPLEGSSALILSGDRYFVADLDLAGDVAAVSYGRPKAWRESGLIRDLWRDAPQAAGRFPWEEPGVTAAYADKGTGAHVIISRFRRWVRQGNSWTGTGTVPESWIVGDAGPPAIDGSAPWDGVGVTATYFSPGGAAFTAISQNKGWFRRTSDPNPSNWTWGDAGFFLADTVPWSTAPAVRGQRPHEGRGVTAAYYLSTKLVVISADRIWTYANGVWSGTGMLDSAPGWSSAPPARCTP